MAAAHAIPLPQQARRIMPEMMVEKGSLGSDVVAVKCGSKRTLQVVAEQLAESFRKGWIDFAQGIAVFMAPARNHETVGILAKELVEALCESQDIDVVGFGSTTVSAGVEAGSADPDESFLVGERATRYLGIDQAQGWAAANTDLGDAPPDLVVEVEHTHYDPNKVNIYRAAGVKELWDLATGATGRSPKITDLQAEGGPTPIETSRILPSIRADSLADAVDALRAIGGLRGFIRRHASGEPVAERLLAVASGLASSDRK